MSKIDMSVNVEASPESVFEVFAGFEKYPEVLEGVVKVERLTEGRIGSGTKWRETRVVFKKESSEIMELTEYEKPKRFSVYCDSCGYDVKWTTKVEPRGGGSLVSMEMTSRPRTLIGKLMIPVAKLMAGSMKKAVSKDFEQMKLYVENRESRTTVEQFV